MSDITAVAEFTGTFRQGDTALLKIKITEFGGNPIDPYQIICTISGPTEDGSASTTALTVTPFQADRGFYVCEWEVDEGQAIGTYQIDWSYIIDGVENHEYQRVTVTSGSAPVPLLYTDRMIAFRAALEHHIVCAQAIPVYYEQSKPSYDLKTFQFSFKNWNQTAGVRVYRNERLVSSDIQIDHTNGKVVFPEAIREQETINVDYNFRWFTEDDLNRFLFNAVQHVNIFPPHSSFTLDNVPDKFIPTILYGAARDALRQLLMCLQFQQPQQVFGGPERAQQAFQGFETLKKNYETDWEKMLEQKKYGPYPQTRVTSTPEYTLPGGRCISLYTKGLCKIGNSIFEATMNEIFDLFKQKHMVEILSHSDYSGNMVFAPINHIWLSGEKTVYEVKTKYGYDVRASDEHLFFVNGKYMPLMKMQEGDNIVICDDHHVEYDRVKSIRKLRTKEIMCDLEVYGTANLFANGIKCHNSRWFRYLFKS